MLPTTFATIASLSECTRVGDRHIMPARSPSIGCITSMAIGLQGTMFATLGVSPASHLGPNPYHPSPEATNISPGSNLHFTFSGPSYLKRQQGPAALAVITLSRYLMHFGTGIC